MRIDRYWKQAAVGLLAIVILTMTGGNLGSLTIANSQPLKAQGQTLSSPDKTIVGDEGGNARSFRTATASQPVIQTKAQIAAFGEVITPKADTTSLSRAGRLTMMVNYGTTAQLLPIIIEMGRDGLIVVDGGWTNNTDYLLNQIKQEGGHVQAWLLTHSDPDHAGALVDISYKYNGETTIDGIYHSFAEDNWYVKKDPGVVEVVAYIKGAFGLMSQNTLHEDTALGQVIQAGPAKIQVLNQACKMNNDFINNSSVVYMAPLSGANTVFLRDLAKSGGEQPVADHDLNALKCDTVRVAHHGQNDVGCEVYKALGPSVALRPTPQWLWDNNNGGGSGNGTWFTWKIKNWMVRPGVNANCYIKDGDQMIE